MIRVRDLLETKGDAIHAVDPDAPVLRAIRLMAEHGVGALLVMRDGELTGIVSERDYARKVVLHGRASDETAVREIMSAPVITVTPEDSVSECMRLMTERHIRHLAVVVDGRVTGVVSIGDLVREIIEDQQRTIEQLENYIRS
jgi:CBS domain-containing protein